MNKNEFKVIFGSGSENESFARMVISAFAARLDPTLEELADMKTAVSEAVTNSIIHGYGGREGDIEMTGRIDGNEVSVEIVDFGVGIEDIPKAMEPMFTTRPDIDRSGMGFALMEAFMDGLEVESSPGKGTRIRMKKKLGVI